MVVLISGRHLPGPEKLQHFDSLGGLWSGPPGSHIYDLIGFGRFVNFLDYLRTSRGLLILDAKNCGN